MIDAFKIGISLDMKSNAMGFLAALGRTLGTTDRQVKTLTSHLGGLHTVGVAVGLALAGGAVKTTEALVKHGAAVSDVEAKMRALGMTEAAVMRARGAATRASLTVPGTTIPGNETAILALRAVLPNSKEAEAALPAYLRAARDVSIFNDSHGTHKDATQLLPIIKALENQGAFMKNGRYDLARVAKAIMSGEAALELTHGVLTPQMFYRFTRMAGVSAQAMDMTDFIKYFTEMMSGVGSTGGRGMQMAAKTFLGGQFSQPSKDQLIGLGIISKDDVKNVNGHYSLKPGHHVKGYDELIAKGFAQWFHDVMQPAMVAHGHTGKTAVLTALGSLPVTEQKFFGFLYTNWAQIEKFSTQFDKRMGTDANKQLMDHSVAANVTAFTSAWSNLLTVLGEPLNGPAIVTLKGLTGALHDIQSFASAHSSGVNDVVVGGLGMAFLRGGKASWTLLRGVTTAAGRFLGVFGGPEAVAAETSLETLGAGAAVAGSFLSFATGIGEVAAAIAYAKLVFKGWGHPGSIAPPRNMPGFGPGGHTDAPNLDNLVPHHDAWIPPAHGGAPIVVHAALFVDGRKMAENTSKHQADAMSRPSGGPTRFDGRMTPSFPGNTIGI